MLYRGQTQCKVLVIFPQVAKAIAERRAKLKLPAVPVTELQYGLDEVTELVNLLDAKLLAGPKATLHGMLDALAEGWDIVWLVTHAEPEGWYLNDGLVDASETTSMIRSTGAFLTVMNTCSSMEVAKAAADELGTAFVCTLRQVPDRKAFITAVIFAQKLRAGLDYEAAYQEAKPGQDDTYQLIEARRGMSQSDQYRSNRGQPIPDAETLIQFIQSVKDLEVIVNGSARFGLPSLKEAVTGLQTDTAIIKKKVEAIEERQKMRAWVFWSMGATIVILLLTVGLLAVRLIGGI